MKFPSSPAIITGAIFMLLSAWGSPAHGFYLIKSEFPSSGSTSVGTGSSRTVIVRSHLHPAAAFLDLPFFNVQIYPVAEGKPLEIAVLSPLPPDSSSRGEITVVHSRNVIQVFGSLEPRPRLSYEIVQIGLSWRQLRKLRVVSLRSLFLGKGTFNAPPAPTVSQSIEPLSGHVHLSISRQDALGRQRLPTGRYGQWVDAKLFSHVDNEILPGNWAAMQLMGCAGIVRYTHQEVKAAGSELRPFAIRRSPIVVR